MWRLRVRWDAGQSVKLYVRSGSQRGRELVVGVVGFVVAVRLGFSSSRL